MKLVLVLVLIAAWHTAPSAAMAATSEDTAATLAVYQMECRPLSPRLRARLTELTQTLDGDRIAVSVTEKRQDLLTSGKKLWCATARRVVVDPLDRSVEWRSTNQMVEGATVNCLFGSFPMG